jgi:hypothetical protein
MSKQITLEQKMMASQEYGIKLSTKKTESQACKSLKNHSRFSNQTIWSNKLGK